MVQPLTTSKLNESGVMPARIDSAARRTELESDAAVPPEPAAESAGTSTPRARAEALDLIRVGESIQVDIHGDLSPLDRVVVQINTFCKRAAITYMLRVGQIIVETFYAGDIQALRKRARKDVSLRRLAHHPDLCLRPEQLYRVVASYELFHRLGLRSQSRLSTSHLHCCLPFSETDQERLLRSAESEHWSVQRLRQQIRTEGLTPTAERGGRKRQRPSLRRAIREINTVLDELGAELDGPDPRRYVVPLVEGGSDARELVGRLRDLCFRIESGARRATVSDWEDPEEDDGTDSWGDSAIPLVELEESSDNASAAVLAARCKILIVEDDTRLARAFARIASVYGHVTIAGSVREAEAALKQMQGNYNVIIMDIVLVDGSGLAALERLRRNFPDSHAHVLVASGHVERRFVNAASGLGAQFLAKPFGSKRLHQFLRSAVSAA